MLHVAAQPCAFLLVFLQGGRGEAVYLESWSALRLKVNALHLLYFIKKEVRFMQYVKDTLDYYGLCKSYDEGCFDTADFVRQLVEHGWFDRYVSDFIVMVNDDLPSFEASSQA